MIGISSQIRFDELDAHLRGQLGEDKRLLTWSQLDELFRWMSWTSWLIIAE